MRRPALLIAAVTGLVIAALIAVLATRKPALTKVADSPLINHVAPDITASSLDGQTVHLTDMRGRFVVLNFFASWCIPCRQEHPELLKFSQEHAQADDARILQVVFDDEASAARTFAAKNTVNWPVLTDPDGTVALDFGVRGPPESFIIGPDGTVLYKIVGQVDAAGLDGLLRRTVR
jgi:cytochrome c biogenesis protein CcmG, thiol:disulfide interchange protein DsbE